jgi:hypothetical protein
MSKTNAEAGVRTALAPEEQEIVEDGVVAGDS